MNLCMSLHSHALNSLQSITVKDRKALVISMNSRGLLTSWSRSTTRSFASDVETRFSATDCLSLERRRFSYSSGSFK